MSNNCEPIKSCGQTSIPQTDDSQINCDNITTTDCVNLVKDYLSLQVSSADNLTILLDKIIEKLFKPTKYLSALSFDEETGILTATLTDNSTVTVDLSNLATPETTTTLVDNGGSFTYTSEDGTITTVTLPSGSGGIQSVVAGTNISINNADPQNPIISSTGSSIDQNNIVRVITIEEVIDISGSSRDQIAASEFNNLPTSTRTIEEDEIVFIDIEFIREGDGEPLGKELYLIKTGKGVQTGIVNSNLLLVRSEISGLRVTDINVTGTTTKTITVTNSDNSTVSTNFTDLQGVESVVAGTNISINNADPQNPIISSSGGVFVERTLENLGTTTTYLVQPSDFDKLKIFSSNSTVTVTVNTNSLTNIGDAVHVDYIGTGSLTFNGNATFRQNVNRTLVSDGQYSRIAVQKISSTEYRVFGELGIL